MPQKAVVIQTLQQTPGLGGGGEEHAPVVAQTVQGRVVIARHHPAGQAPQQLPVSLLAGLHQDRAEGQLPAQGDVTQSLGF